MTDIGGAGELLALLTALAAALVLGVLALSRRGPLRCLLCGHQTKTVYTPTEGQVQCLRCQAVLEVWRVLRPEQVAQELRSKQQFWARVEARQPRVGLRRVK
jgi:hypothetical protein